jgi:hypothetical protein
MGQPSPYQPGLGAVPFAGQQPGIYGAQPGYGQNPYAMQQGYGQQPGYGTDPYATQISGTQPVGTSQPLFGNNMIASLSPNSGISISTPGTLASNNDLVCDHEDDDDYDDCGNTITVFSGDQGGSNGTAWAYTYSFAYSWAA